jgi:heme A synthase
MAVAVGGRLRAGSVVTAGWFQGLSWATAICVFAMIVLGGVVRVTDSGLGCGDDWPLCSGQWLPPLESKAIIEYAHRVAASFLVGPLVAATFIAAWLCYRREAWIVWPATAAILLVIVQALLGAAAVVTELSAHTVMTHLAVAELTMACCVLVLVMSYRGGMRGGPQPWATGKARLFPPLSLVAAGMLFVLLLSGSYLTNTASATWACPTWPLCTNEWSGLFPGGKLAMIHMAHRWVALIAGLVVMYSLHLGFRGRTQPPLIRLLSMAAVALFVAQALAGAGVIWAGFGRDVELRALHLALASGMWAIVAALAVLCYAREPGPTTTAR